MEKLPYYYRWVADQRYKPADEHAVNQREIKAVGVCVFNFQNEKSTVLQDLQNYVDQMHKLVTEKITFPTQGSMRT